jgi:hypothetical protein
MLLLTGVGTFILQIAKQGGVAIFSILQGGLMNGKLQL